MVELNKIYNLPCLEMLAMLPDCSVNCCVTSPPYYGLRDYGVDGQIGLEETPEAYVAKMVEVFREVRRVLKDDGTLWLNMGDSYVTSPPGNNKANDVDGLYQRRMDLQIGHGEDKNAIWKCAKGSGLPNKNLLGMPWRVAFALQSDGWILRQDIIWHKPNPMPESVTDRCTKAHEYIFLMSKSQRYYYDADAIKEDAVWDVDGEGTIARKGRQNDNSKIQPGALVNGIRKLYPNGKHGDGQQSPKTINGKRNKRSVWTVTTKPFSEAHFATFPEDLIVPCIKAGCHEGGIVLDLFMGAGTTALVANKLGRRYLGSEINPDYCKIAEKRILPHKMQQKLF